MTFADEAEISSPSTEGVRLEEFVQPEHVCSKGERHERETDFLN